MLLYAALRMDRWNIASVRLRSEWMEPGGVRVGWWSWAGGFGGGNLSRPPVHQGWDGGGGGEKRT